MECTECAECARRNGTPGLTGFHRFPASPRHPGSNLRFWKMLPNLPPQQGFIIRLVSSAGDQPLDRIQKRQPVLQRRFGHRLPILKPPAPMEKPPLPFDSLDVNLKFFAVVSHPFPAYFCFWHGLNSLAWALVFQNDNACRAFLTNPRQPPPWPPCLLRGLKNPSSRWSWP